MRGGLDRPREQSAEHSNTSQAGRTRSTSISTVPGSAWLIGRAAGSAVTSSSTRTRPSRISLATRVTRARRLPYSAHGKPCEANRSGLSSEDPSERGRRRELRHDAQRAVRHDRREPLAFPTTAPTLRSTASPMRPATGARSTRRSTSYSKRFTAAPAVALSLQRDSVPRSRWILTSRSLSRVFCSWSIRASAARGRLGARALLDFGSRSRVLLFGHQAVGAQARQPARFVLGEAERRFCFAEDRALFVARPAAAAAFVLDAPLLGRDLTPDGGDFRLERGEAGARLLERETFGVGLELHEHVAAPHGAPTARLTGARARPSARRPDAPRRWLRCARPRSFRTRESARRRTSRSTWRAARRRSHRKPSTLPLGLYRAHRSAERTRHAAPL